MGEQLNDSGTNTEGNAAAEVWNAAMNGEAGQRSNVVDFNEARVARGMEPVQEQRSQDYYDSFGKDENGNAMNIFDAQDAKHADAAEQYYLRLKRQQDSFKGTKYEEQYSDAAIAKKLQAFDEKYRNQQGVNTEAAGVGAGAAQTVEQPAEQQPAAQAGQTEQAAQPEQQGAQVAESQFGDAIEERDQDYDDYRRQAQEAEAVANGAAETASAESEAERLQREQDNADVDTLLADIPVEKPADVGDWATKALEEQAREQASKSYRMDGARLDRIEAENDPEAKRLIDAQGAQAEAQRAQEAREVQVEAQNFKKDFDAFAAQSAKKYPRFMSRFTVDFGDFWNRMLGRISGGHGSAA
jgi:hypothetical protein